MDQFEKEMFAAIGQNHQSRTFTDYRSEHKKKVCKVVTLAIGAMLSVVLGSAGLLAPCLAGGAAVVLVCIACFIAGRIYEATKR